MLYRIPSPHHGQQSEHKFNLGSRVHESVAWFGLFMGVLIGVGIGIALGALMF